MAPRMAPQAQTRPYERPLDAVSESPASIDVSGATSSSGGSHLISSAARSAAGAELSSSNSSREHSASNAAQQRYSTVGAITAAAAAAAEQASVDNNNTGSNYNSTAAGRYGTNGYSSNTAAAGYGGAGYGSSGYGSSGYGAGGYSTGYGGGYSSGGYGGYGSGYGSSYGGMSSYGRMGGYGSSYGGSYGMMGGMGMGMEGGMGAQYSWLHSIQHFTSSLGYLTEVCAVLTCAFGSAYMPAALSGGSYTTQQSVGRALVVALLLGMNTQALGFFASNMMAFLENASLALASLQPWREFPPGHPRHGKYLTSQNMKHTIPLISSKRSVTTATTLSSAALYAMAPCHLPAVASRASEPPPTPEEERKRVSKVKVLRWVAGLCFAYAVSFTGRCAALLHCTSLLML
eukprot:14252-Heterococcus_DN1.PRE.2